MLNHIKDCRLQRNTKNMYKVLILFTIQFGLLWCIFYSLFVAPMLDVITREDVILLELGNELIEKIPYILIFTKFLCGIVIHISNQPKTSEVFNRIFYLKGHPHKFDRISMPLFICILKLVMEIFLEIVTLVLISTQTHSLGVILYYLSFICISSLDSIYYD